MSGESGSTGDHSRKSFDDFVCDGPLERKESRRRSDDRVACSLFYSCLIINFL